jgi:hypothetical protein
MNRTLFADAHVTVTLDPATGLVRYQRTRQPYPSLEVVRDVHTRLAAVLQSLTHGNLKLLIDTREAPARNDDGFEAEIRKALQSFVPRFTSRAVLVKSAVGKLQVQRMERSSSASAGAAAVFASETEALAHLGIPAPRV